MHESADHSANMSQQEVEQFLHRYGPHLGSRAQLQINITTDAPWATVAQFFAAEKALSQIKTYSAATLRDSQHGTLSIAAPYELAMTIVERMQSGETPHQEGQLSGDIFTALKNTQQRKSAAIKTDNLDFAVNSITGFIKALNQRFNLQPAAEYDPKSKSIIMQPSQLQAIVYHACVDQRYEPSAEQQLRTSGDAPAKPANLNPQRSVQASSTQLENNVVPLQDPISK